MDAMRCPSCGETRWRLTSLPVTRATHCADCGVALVAERRRPGRAAAAGAEPERRFARPVARLDEQSPAGA